MRKLTQYVFTEDGGYLCDPAAVPLKVGKGGAPRQIGGDTTFGDIIAYGGAGRGTVDGGKGEDGVVLITEHFNP